MIRLKTTASVARLIGVIAVLAGLANTPSAYSQAAPAPAASTDVSCAEVAASEAQPAQCAFASLRRLDARLNAEYRDLRSTLQGAMRSGLVGTQRTWLRDRNATCGIAPDTSESDNWLAAIAVSPGKASCVIETTQRRIVELETLRRQAAGAWSVAEVLPSETAPAKSPLAAASPQARAYRLVSQQARRTGRYYFELTIDETRAAGIVASVGAGIAVGDQFLGIDQEVRARDLLLNLGPGSSIRIVGGDLGDLRVPKRVIGVAVDLDAGQVYAHRDGNWQNGAVPGNDHGIAIAPTTEVRGEIAADIPFATLIDKGILTPNFGDIPFSGFQPAGYRGFDWPAHLAAPPPPAPIPGDLPRSRRVAGGTQMQWIKRYAEWILSFRKGESPSTDETGARCGAGQSGAMWFLTGSKTPVKVNRRCTMPAGKPLLVPILNVTAQAPVGQPCEKLQLAIEKFTERTSKLRFALDGKASPDIDKRKQTSGCLSIRNGNTGVMNTTVASGYWVFLPPLSPGRHVVEFGGLSEVSGFEQDITYELEVK